MSGVKFRLAHILVTEGGNENTMAPYITQGLSEFLPAGIEVVFDETRQGQSDRPDFTLKRGQAVVGYVEAKLPTTLGAAFKEDSAGSYQIDKYRSDGLPVLLTDGLRWYDVTDPSSWNPQTFAQRLTAPFVTFADQSEDEQSELALRTLLNAAFNIRPKYSSSSASIAMQTMIRRINSAHDRQLEGAWEAAKQFLHSNSNPEELGDGQVGELIAFTLLAVAAALEPLPDQTFVTAARTEWREDSRSWSSGQLPPSLRSALNDFRRVDGESGDTLLGTLGWVTIRSVASSLRKDGAVDWDRLSALWDNYLGLAGQRVRLGSWQTPPAVAEYQAKQTAKALQALGYHGFSDPNVTTIDPCCGTGVYMQEVIHQVVREGGSAVGLSASATAPARLLGSDISPTAVAATHIRVAALGVRPNLYMADTLSASPEAGAQTGIAGASETLALFTFDEAEFDAALVRAVRRDHQELSAWASRDNQRDPLVAIIGNPPYGRSLLDPASYKDRGWYKDVFDHWRKGSGGRGSLQDPFTGFLAWAFRLCQTPHSQLSAGTPFGVVSFITNRSWVDGKTFAPFRKWLRQNAATIQISDFGLGSRGGASGRWSDQPFAIETGTAIMTVVFQPDNPAGATVTYQKVAWINEKVEFVDTELVVSQDNDWTGAAPLKELFSSSQVTSGVKTGSDRDWIRTSGDRDFSVRHAYRAFDNRYSPTAAPHKTRRGEEVLPGNAKPSADWRKAKLFTPHINPDTRPDWYLIGQSRSAKPGTGLHATKHLPDNDFFNVRGGRVLPVRESTMVPAEYAEVAERLGVDGSDFWLLTLAVAHHHNYWVDGTLFAGQLADNTVEPPYPQGAGPVGRLLEIGGELVDLWSLDAVTPASFTGGPGAWKFEGHDYAEQIVLHGRKVLVEWRKARPGNWDRGTAEEYAKSVAALIRVDALTREVAQLLSP